MVETKQNKVKQYAGALDVQQAAAAMQAARLNSVDLLDSADILFNMKRFAHSVALSILAIEEAGKLTILQAILLRVGEAQELWRYYRLHRAKTENLNLGIMARVRATFPEIPLEDARKIAALGPSPDDLEVTKQRAIYSDCILDSANWYATFHGTPTGDRKRGNGFVRPKRSCSRRATEFLKNWKSG